MKKTILLHIGVHKTGSTSIQHTGELNQQLLRDHDIAWLYKHDFFIPFHRIFYEHQDSAYNDFVVQNCQTYFDKSMSDIKQPTVLLVNEGFSYCNPYDEVTFDCYYDPKGKYINNRKVFVKRLAHLFKHHDVKVSVYLRRQDLFIESLYSQVIKGQHHVSLSFQEYLNRYPLRLINWLELVEDYAEAFGAEHVNVAVFEKDQLKNKSIIDDFYKQIGIDKPLRLPASQARNERISAEYFERFRSFNSTRSPDLKLQVLRSKNIFSALQFHSTKKVTPYGFFTPDQRDSFLEQFKASNKKVAQDYLNSDKPLFNMDINEKLQIVDQAILPVLTPKEISEFEKILYNPG